MPALGSEATAIIFSKPVIQESICFGISRIIIVAAVSPCGKISPCGVVVNIGDWITITIMRDFQVLGHPPLITDFDSLVYIAIVVSYCSCLQFQGRKRFYLAITCADAIRGIGSNKVCCVRYEIDCGTGKAPYPGALDRSISSYRRNRICTPANSKGNNRISPIWNHISTALGCCLCYVTNSWGCHLWCRYWIPHAANRISGAFVTIGSTVYFRIIMPQTSMPSAGIIVFRRGPYTRFGTKIPKISGFSSGSAR